MLQKKSVKDNQSFKSEYSLYPRNPPWPFEAVAYTTVVCYLTTGQITPKSTINNFCMEKIKKSRVYRNLKHITLQTFQHSSSLDLYLIKRHMVLYINCGIANNQRLNYLICKYLLTRHLLFLSSVNFGTHYKSRLWK
jgi:hypothetical protein